MGCQISCGKTSLNFSSGAWFVMNRAELYFTPEEAAYAWGKPCPPGDEYYGQIPARALKAMFEDLPKKFSDAVKPHDLMNSVRPVKESDWSSIIKFLEEAVSENENVHCSY